MYAIIETGGKQYRVSPGQTIWVERLEAEPESEVQITAVLLVAGDDGKLAVGSPYVNGAHVAAKVLEHFRGPKIRVFKYKPKVNYRRRQGHRQPATRLEILAIAQS